MYAHQRYQPKYVCMYGWMYVRRGYTVSEFAVRGVALFAIGGSLLTTARHEPSGERVPS